MGQDRSVGNGWPISHRTVVDHTFVEVWTPPESIDLGGKSGKVCFCLGGESRQPSLFGPSILQFKPNSYHSEKSRAGHHHDRDEVFLIDIDSAAMCRPIDWRTPASCVPVTLVLNLRNAPPNKDLIACSTLRPRCAYRKVGIGTVESDASVMATCDGRALTRRAS